VKKEQERKIKKIKMDEYSEDSNSTTDNIFRPVKIERKVMVKKHPQVIIEDEPSQ
jgi:hypothetical protein